MSEKIKFAQLPKEEQVELAKEAESLGIRGIFETWNVETLKAKIEAAKAAKSEQKPETDEQNVEIDEQKVEVDEQEPEKDEQKVEVKESAKKEEKHLICHICRSKVVDGVCTGCGFTLKK